MRQPDFLVIGAKKAGSTWLDQVLRSHAKIRLPGARKEVAYFDLFYERGPEWYARFFRAIPAGVLAGESTPEYMHHAQAPARIERDLPSTRLIAILRDPLDRAYSEWGHQAMRFAEPRTFEEYVRDEPAVLDKSRYAQQLRQFARAHADGRLHVIILEEALQDPHTELRRLGEFLGVDPTGFSADAGRKMNETYRPRFARGFALARTISDGLRAHGLDRVANLAQRAGVRRMFGSHGRFPDMTAAQRAALAEFHADVCADMEATLGRPLDAWRNTVRA